MSKRSFQLDSPQPLRQEDSLDTKVLHNFLTKNSSICKDSDVLKIMQFPGGASNLTYQLSINDHDFILRTAPKGANIKGAHDMQREFNVLQNLSPYFPYCPKTILYCDNDAVLGRPFFIMEKVTGLIPRETMPIELSPHENKELCQNLIKVQVALHEVDIKNTPLKTLGKPEGYVQRQVYGWSQRYQNALTDDVPDGLKLQQWLTQNQTQDFPQPALIHNDFKFDNIILNPEDPTEIISVLDWEMTTLGDPLMDLGCSLAYWIEASDPKSLQNIRMLPTTEPGMMTRLELIQYYCQLRNIDIDDFRFYRVFGLFRLAVIVQQIYARFVSGKTHNPKFKHFGLFCNLLIDAAQQATHSKIKLG